MGRSMTLFVGDNNIDLAEKAKLFDPTAYLITSSNYSKQHHGTCYTSLADLPNNQVFRALLESAGKIIYYPPPNGWESRDKMFKETTESILLSVGKCKGIQIENAPRDPYEEQTAIMLALQDVRKSNKPQIWSAGGSDSVGGGIEKYQRYGEIIAKELNMPISTLACGCSSIIWNADQILRSDIRKDDIVIFGLPPQTRFPYFNLKEINHICISSFENLEVSKEIDLNILDHPTLQYGSVLAIHQVVNFCNKIGAKIIIAGLSIDLKLLSHLKDIPNYVHLANDDCSWKFLDIASDSKHPGPITHKWFAEKILKKLKEIE